MREKVIVAALALVTGLALAAPSARADLLNPGFEDGLNNWTVYGTAGTSTDLMGLLAKYGSAFAFVESGTGGGTPTASTITQTFTALAGQAISGYAAFFAGDNLPWNDRAFLSISDGETLTTLWSKSVESVGGHGYSDWTAFSWIADSAGLYTLTFGIRDGLDGYGTSLAALDMPASVAVPGPIAGAGLVPLLGLLAWRRRKRPAAATA